MKKVLVICLTLVLMMSMSVTAFAENGGFVSSPSGNPAPRLISFNIADEECTGELVITPYSDRTELSEALQALLKKAYDQIKGSDDISELNTDLAKLAADKKIKGTDLAVSELFDIHVAGCDFHDSHYDFDVVLEPDTLKNFVGLLHMNKNGEWELIKDAKVISNGEHLAFSVESLSPFAIVVNTAANPSQTGDGNMIPVYITVMAVCALAIILIVAKSKKREA